MLIRVVDFDFGAVHGFPGGVQPPISNGADVGRSSTFTHSIQLQNRQVKCHEELDHITMNGSCPNIQ